MNAMRMETLGVIMKSTIVISVITNMTDSTSISDAVISKFMMFGSRCLAQHLWRFMIIMNFNVFFHHGIECIMKCWFIMKILAPKF